MRREVLCYSSPGQRAFMRRTGCISVVVAAMETVPSHCLTHQIESLRAVFVAAFWFRSCVLSQPFFSHSPLLLLLLCFSPFYIRSG